MQRTVTLTEALDARGYRRERVWESQPLNPNSKFDIYSTATGQLCASLSERETWAWLAEQEDTIE